MLLSYFWGFALVVANYGDGIAEENISVAIVQKHIINLTIFLKCFSIEILKYLSKRVRHWRIFFVKYANTKTIDLLEI